MCRLDTSSVHLKTGTMKRITILSGLLTVALIFIACNDDSSDGTSGDNTNQNANPSVVPNATNLEMPRLDEQTGDIYSHYVTYNGTQVLNYTVDWHKEKKHSRWVAFVFTNTTGRHVVEPEQLARDGMERHCMERRPLPGRPRHPGRRAHGTGRLPKERLQPGTSLRFGRPAVLHGCQRADLLPVQHESANGKIQPRRLGRLGRAGAELGAQQFFPRHALRGERRHDSRQPD